MDRGAISQVRRFNRLVTQRVGALDDHFLSRDRPLGEARLLWEIGTEGADVRALRTALELDSGYVSRLLRSLEQAGFVTVEPSSEDRRVRTVRLTEEGLAEREALDRGSDELARSFLAPLSHDQRERLVRAMSDVERLLTASMVRIAPTGLDDPGAQYCLREYAAELDRRFATGFDPTRSRAIVAHEVKPPAGLLLVATLHAEPIGCGALRFHGHEPAEIKHLWVAPSARGLGIGRRLLAELEAQAGKRSKNPRIRLDTNAALTEATSLYRSAGYTEVPPFNDERYADHWFEKRLGA